MCLWAASSCAAWTASEPGRPDPRDVTADARDGRVTEQLRREVDGVVSVSGDPTFRTDHARDALTGV